MKKFIIIFLSYLLITFNSFVFAVENNNSNILKIGILAPFTGEFKFMGEAVLFSVNLALHDINDESIKIYPKDSGSNKEKIISACKEFQDEGIKIIIGPVDATFTNELKRFDNLIFLSLSNMNSVIEKNVVMMGINLESQLLAIKKFIKKENKKKTIILFPDDNKSNHIEKKIKQLGFSNSKIFKYSNDSEVLTGQIEKLTNYKQRKINLESRIKILENSELPKDKRELDQLKQRYTLGNVNFDSVVIIDFDDGLKSVLTSLAYTDVSDKDVLIISSNQWFDNSILSETSIKSFYFPSVNLKNFESFNKKFYKAYEYFPNEISIISYDITGFIYYLWKNNNKIKTAVDFNLKEEIKGKIGNFKISENKVIQKLEIYKLEENTFIKNKL